MGYYYVVGMHFNGTEEITKVQEIKSDVVYFLSNYARLEKVLHSEMNRLDERDDDITLIVDEIKVSVMIFFDVFVHHLKGFGKKRLFARV